MVTLLTAMPASFPLGGDAVLVYDSNPGPSPTPNPAPDY